MQGGLKNLIKEYLKAEYPRIVHKGEIGKIAVNEWGYENENMGRRCRELEDEKIIEMIPDEKGRAMYRWKPEGSVSLFGTIEPIKVKPEKKDEMNDRLRELLRSTKPSVENLDRIKAIQNAIKSKYDLTKKSVLETYKGPSRPTLNVT